MKELTIEEKARRYDEALERARKEYKNHEAFKGYCEMLEHIFTELKEKESEDEKIRKSLIILLQHFCKGYRVPGLDFPVSYKEMLAWLEKQGETTDVDPVFSYNNLVTKKQNAKKPTDKVEPKFKIGDWVVYCGDTYQITGLNNNTFTLTGCDGSYFFNLVESTHEPSFHLWSIQDAKDGDILVVENIFFIYKRALASHIVSYCKLINDVFEPTVDARTCCEGNPYVHPATKEQRDLLFSKMREFGYEWDTKEKQLMKVPRKVQAIGVLKQLIDEQKSVDVEEPDFFDDFRNSDVEVDSNEDGLIAATIKYKNEQNPAWSEDDENMLRRVFDSLNTYAKNAYPCLKSVVEEEIDWLKSIKERTKGE